MPSVYQIRLKAGAFDTLKVARERIRERLGSTQIGQKLTGMSPQEAGALANELLDLLDAVDGAIGRARAAD